MPLPASVQPLSLMSHMDPLRMAELLRRKVAGQPLPYTFIHEVSPYSAAPEDLVRGREHAPGTGQAGDGRGMAWYFCGAANCHESAGGAPRRNRQVGGGRERRFWHPEGGKKPIPGEAYKRTLSYVLKIKSRPGASKSFRNKRLGWCMLEVGLEQQDGVAGYQDQLQLVLCKVYRSPRSTADLAETSTAAAGAEDVVPADISGVEDWLQYNLAQEGGAIPGTLNATNMTYRDAEPSGGMPCPACDNQSIQVATEANSRVADSLHSYIPETPVTTQTTWQSILTSIQLKQNVSILDIEKTRTVDQDAFVVEAISICRKFEYMGMSVDWESSSEGMMSFTLVPSEMFNEESIQLMLDTTVEKLQKIATVDRLQDRSVISLTGYPHMSMANVGLALYILESSHVPAERFSPVSSKMRRVSLVVHDSVAEHCLHVLRSAFEIKLVNEMSSMINVWPPPPDPCPPRPPPPRKPCPPKDGCAPPRQPKPCPPPPPKPCPPPPRQPKPCSKPPPKPCPPPPRQPKPCSKPPTKPCKAPLKPCPKPPPPAWVECRADFDSYDEVQSEEEEQELSETDESGTELGSATEEMEERSRRESMTSNDGGDQCGSSEPAIWEICGWVRRVAIAKPSLPSDGRANNDSLCSRLAVWLTGICAKQNSPE